MTARKPWSSFEVVLAASSVIAISFLAALVAAAFAGYLLHRSAPKTVEVVRYGTLANSALAPPARSAPKVRATPLAP